MNNMMPCAGNNDSARSGAAHMIRRDALGVVARNGNERTWKFSTRNVVPVVFDGDAMHTDGKRPTRVRAVMTDARAATMATHTFARAMKKTC